MELFQLGVNDGVALAAVEPRGNVEWSVSLSVFHCEGYAFTQQLFATIHTIKGYRLQKINERGEGGPVRDKI